jgi:hypothetical protein
VSFLSAPSSFGLTVAGHQVIASLSSPNSNAETSGTFYFQQSELFYDIKVEFFQSGVSPKALLLQWETSINTRTVTKSVIPTFRLFFQVHSSGTPQSLTVQPAVACAARLNFAQCRCRLISSEYLEQVGYCSGSCDCRLSHNIHHNSA